jgi:NAD(P)-dependent dehydrogenase (short-subunit alcohol dehydrogenase family)
MSFKGRTALVTGGASGIGRALAGALTRSGARVVVADIDGEAVARTAADLGIGGRQLDVSDEAAFRALVDDVGDIDLLFNNAGISMGGPTHEFTGAHWRRIIDVNLLGVVNGLLAVYPRMVARGSGHIVNTASGVGLLAPPFVTPYAATKHAVVGLSVGLRPEAALHGVKVSVICPGAVETPILDRPPDADLPVRATGTVTARDYLSAIGQKPVAADDFAARALKGVARNKAIIVAPTAAKAPWWINRLSPALAQRLTRSLARKVDRELIQPRTTS